MRISDLVSLAYSQAQKSGFHDNDEKVTFGDRIALIHSEASEALEEYRQTQSFAELWEDQHSGNICTRPEAGRKPIGVPSELADIVIRVADLAGTHGIDLEKAILDKLEYNKSRPYKHNKAF